MARAASSLPVPLSPVKSTVLSLGAARRILAKTFFMAGESPMMNSDALPVSSGSAAGSVAAFCSGVLQGLLDHRLQFVDAKRFHQIVQGPVLDALHRALNGGEAGDHDDLGLRIILRGAASAPPPRPGPAS